MALKRHCPSRTTLEPKTPESNKSVRINPVQILAYQEEGLLLALAQQHPLEGIEGPLAALRGIKLREHAVLWQDIEECEQRRDRVLEGRIECQYLSGNLRAHGADIVTLLDMAIAFEHIDDREIGRRL